MRPLPPALQAALDAGCATLCLCWKLIRADGRVMGFTDHDHDLAFDGVVFGAASGFAAAEAEASLGLSASATEVAGALDSEDITEADLSAGLYDDARVEVWLVDWSAATDPGRRYLLRAGSIGRVRRGQVHFEAELRSLSHYLEQPSGRLFSRGCDAIVGDARCRVDLDDPAFSASGAVVASGSPSAFTASGLDGHASGWFVHGLLRWTSGANAGRSARVRAHRLEGGVAHLELDTPMPEAIAPGDGLRVSAGCDRAFSTCREKFSNAVNFRGFPHMPGNDFALSYPNHDDGSNDGSPIAH